MALWVAFHALPLGVGLVLQQVFDALAGPRPAAISLAGLLAVLVGVEAARAADSGSPPASGLRHGTTWVPCCG